jgi:hypothetical protein
MDKNYKVLKFKALQLRKKGLSYNEINKSIQVSKSTLSYWLKSVPLKAEYRKRLYTKRIDILCRGPKSIKEKRAKEVSIIVQRAKKEIKLPISLESLRLMGACLYWAEGSKKKMCEITNSDPYLILFFIKWVEKIFKISPENLKARLNIYSQQNEIKIIKFWSDLTGIPTKRFGKTFIKPLSKNYKKNNLYYGTIRIEVPKSVDLNYKISSWINLITDSLKPKIKLVQKKWRSLEISRPVNL